MSTDSTATSPNDEVTDFDPATGHLDICLIVSHGSVRCNRDCTRRLLDLAHRLESLLNPQPDPEHVAPECPQHNETQHRDGKPPWCSRCGWTQARAPRPAMKIGPSPEERLAMNGSAHQPWSPEGGYIGNDSGK